MARGTLFLVVGPSGAGKDTLIEGARAALEPGGAYVFPRRAITRPQGAGGEDHEAVSPEAFADREAEGGFFATWRAHGLDYGLPTCISGTLNSGRHVVVNVSRAILADIAGRVSPTVAIEIAAAARNSAPAAWPPARARTRPTPPGGSPAKARHSRTAFRCAGSPTTARRRKGSPASSPR